MLRPLAAGASIFNFFAQIMLTMIVVYASRVMHMSGAEIGIMFAGFGVGGVVAATTLFKLLDRLGYGRLLLIGYAVGAVAIAALPFVSAPPVIATLLFVLLFFVAGVGIVALNIVEMTLRQIATPNSVQGRVNASFRFLVGCLLPIAAAVSGVLGDQFGLRTTLFITAIGIPFSLLLLFFSPLRKVKSADELAPQEA
jgi:predicted MFS family arabinose efflux permease